MVLLQALAPGKRLLQATQAVKDIWKFQLIKQSSAPPHPDSEPVAVFDVVPLVKLIRGRWATLDSRGPLFVFTFNTIAQHMPRQAPHSPTHHPLFRKSFSLLLCWSNRAVRVWCAINTCAQSVSLLARCKRPPRVSGRRNMWKNIPTR